MFKLKTVAVLVLLGLLGVSSASGASIAVFGNNPVATYLSSLGHSVTLVSNSDLETADFLSAFNLFIYTRDGSSFGASLTSDAAANVQDAVTGRGVLFNMDLADSVSAEAGAQTLFSNAVNWIVAGGGFGYIGEFTGSFAALDSNMSGLVPLGLVPGSAGGAGGCEGGSCGLIDLLVPGHPVLSGLVGPLDFLSVEFGAALTGVPAELVIAAFQDQAFYPAIIAFGDQVIPEPATLGMMGLGLLALFAARRQRKG